MPEPSEPTHLFRILRRAATDSLAVDGQKDDFNYVATWMKHGDGADRVEVGEWDVQFWLNRAISKYRAVYGIGTPGMADFFSWAGRSSRPSEPA